MRVPRRPWGHARTWIACFMQYQGWLVSSSCIGTVLLLTQAWILLVRLVGTRGRDWGALVFIAYLFSHLPFFSWARDFFFQFFFFPLLCSVVA